ncbi:MAG: hypothetical protein EP343_08590 [Deltaproteobacteria bacterium]|nr:MAG: hypothetical protein EP343_08590 [Deltaproteobacteria bacterium]
MLQHTLGWSLLVGCFLTLSGCMTGGEPQECKKHSDCSDQQYCIDVAPGDAFLPSYKCLAIVSPTCTSDADCSSCADNTGKGYSCQKGQCIVKGDTTISQWSSESEPPKFCTASKAPTWQAQPKETTIGE